MSRIGIRPIKIEDGVEIEITSKKVIAKNGAKEAELQIPEGIKVTLIDQNIKIERENDSKDLKAKHGLISRLITNLIIGVKNGFTRELEFKGTGYRAAINGSDLVLNMGYSHEFKLSIPEGLTAEVKKNSIFIQGIDKQKVGAFASVVREVRPPEVYKGKGIKYKEEHIRRKAGKKAAK